ncbi:hypothetical protein ACV6EA_15815 [Enterococcus hirae]
MEVSQFNKLGDPIRLTDYVNEYVYHIKYILEKMTFVELTDSSIQKMLKMEEIRAETVWYTYYETNLRAPDYHFLQNELINFGFFRLSFFEQVTQEEDKDFISVDNFIYCYILRLREEKWLSSLFLIPKTYILSNATRRKKQEIIFLNEINMWKDMSAFVFQEIHICNG